jgi:hypothetical protein
MPMTEDELTALQAFPQQSLTEVPRATVSAINDELIKRIYGLPYDAASYAGQVAAVRADGSTLDVAGRNSGPLGFGRAELWQYEPHVVAITSNTNITAAAHQGALLKCSNIGAVTLTFAISGDPLSGIADNFVCQIARLRTSGAVQIARGGGVTNGNPNDHTRVSAGRMAQIWLAGTELGFYGGTEA